MGLNFISMKKWAERSLYLRWLNTYFKDIYWNLHRRTNGTMERGCSTLIWKWEASLYKTATPPTVTDQRVGRKYTVYRWRAHVNPIRDLGLLEYPSVEVGLRYPSQRWIDSPVPPVLYVVCTETDNGLPVLSRPSSSPPRIGLYIPD